MRGQTGKVRNLIRLTLHKGTLQKFEKIDWSALILICFNPCILQMFCNAQKLD